jgi:hypothetical protein
MKHLGIEFLPKLQKHFKKLKTHIFSRVSHILPSIPQNKPQAIRRQTFLSVFVDFRSTTLWHGRYEQHLCFLRVLHHQFLDLSSAYCGGQVLAFAKISTATRRIKLQRCLSV